MATATRCYEGMSRQKPAGAPITRDDLLREYTPVVRRVAYRLAARLPHSVEIDDLVSTGSLGLVDAVDKFDPAKGSSFVSYATLRIRGAILDELRSLDWVPRSVRNRATEIEDAYIRLARRTGRPATDAEVAEELDMSLDDFHALADRVKPMRVVSFEDLLPITDDGRRDVMGGVPDDGSPDPFDELLQARLRGRLEAALGQLQEKHRLVLSLYYFEDLNLKEIGRILGVTESRISQLHALAVLEMRSLLKSEDDSDDSQDEALLMAA